MFDPLRGDSNSELLSLIRFCIDVSHGDSKVTYHCSKQEFLVGSPIGIPMATLHGPFTRQRVWGQSAQLRRYSSACIPSVRPCARQGLEGGARVFRCVVQKAFTQHKLHRIVMHCSCITVISYKEWAICIVRLY